MVGISGASDWARSRSPPSFGPTDESHSGESRFRRSGAIRLSRLGVIDDEDAVMLRFFRPIKHVQEPFDRLERLGLVLLKERDRIRVLGDLSSGRLVLQIDQLDGFAICSRERAGHRIQWLESPAFEDRQPAEALDIQGGPGFLGGTRLAAMASKPPSRAIHGRDIDEVRWMRADARRSRIYADGVRTRSGGARNWITRPRAIIAQAR